ncbi:hypothetical protein [Bacillus sp. SD088]|uniref:hypothetical protein n=1 Tax=Bacillus sp. SD088 TaxID=2782012 RepID=UPI001A9644FF|nr:hypothetical protein [Bacillus sp. SD088]MBO0993293.1 hypothetical protein [Bacillus sp. SD088]
MRKSIVTVGVVTLISFLIFSPRSRKAISNSIDGDMIDKAYELRNILSDFRRNNRDTEYK